MKKILYLIVLLIIATPCFAGGVGYINYEKVAANYSFARNTMMEIQAKGREIDTFLRNKEVEFSKLETPLQKKKFQESVQIELKTKEDAFEKQFDVLLDARGVFSGGTDITDILIQRLNQNK